MAKEKKQRKTKEKPPLKKQPPDLNYFLNLGTEPTIPKRTRATDTTSTPSSELTTQRSTRPADNPSTSSSALTQSHPGVIDTTSTSSTELIQQSTRTADNTSTPSHELINQREEEKAQLEDTDEASSTHSETLVRGDGGNLTTSPSARAEDESGQSDNEQDFHQKRRAPAQASRLPKRPKSKQKANTLRSSTTELIARHEQVEPPAEHETQLVPQPSPPDLLAMLAEESDGDTSPSLNTLEKVHATTHEHVLSTLSTGQEQDPSAPWWKEVSATLQGTEVPLLIVNSDVCQLHVFRSKNMRNMTTVLAAIFDGLCVQRDCLKALLAPSNILIQDATTTIHNFGRLCLQNLGTNSWKK